MGKSPTHHGKNPDSRGWGALARNTWRGLTSMRTALMLLFLLALAALPGALLPQHMLNQDKVTQYLSAHPKIGPLLDRTGFFDVFSSPWFAAIYLLLFVSLLGCLTPRTVEYARACRARPVVTPRNLARLPHHARGLLDGDRDAVLTTVTGRLRGWRTAVREEPDGELSVSAERGYLREAGNLTFHVALLGLLLGIAFGKLFGYSGQIIVLADGDQFCNTGILNYDSFIAGNSVATAPDSPRSVSRSTTSPPPTCRTWSTRALPGPSRLPGRTPDGGRLGRTVAARTCWR